ncbi:hypothetical protein [Klebsiella pneumoniae]|uniref:hypothetical protein n=1 Tax=Klebsiella pneumoniae TaxID=573 RepID=UPI0034D187BA
MSQIIDAATAPAKKAALPWIVTAVLFVIIATGAAGLYFGMLIQRGWDADDKVKLANAYGDALKERDARLKELQAKGNLIEGTFLTKLDGIQVVNKTYYNEVQKETEKLVYTDCKLPDSGVDLLNKHIDDVNMRLIGKGAK